MTSRYIDLADRIEEGAEYSNTTSFCLGIECALRWLDDHPDQVPGPTMTESEYSAAVDAAKTVMVHKIAGAVDEYLTPFIESIIRQEKADALREAADGIQAMDSRATLRGIAASIRVEADRIEEEA